jgi:hypothetical protein
MQAPTPIRNTEMKSYLVNTSPSMREERMLLKTKVREEVELSVIMSA